MENGKLTLRICASLEVDKEMAVAIVRLLQAYADKKDMKQIDRDTAGVFRYVNGKERLTWII